MRGFRTQPSCIAGHFVRTPGSVGRACSEELGVFIIGVLLPLQHLGAPCVLTGLTSGHVSRLLAKLQKEPALPRSKAHGIMELT